MDHQRSIRRLRQRRKFRVRKRIIGSQERPRLSVFRSHKHIYVQLIDDAAGRTLVSASTSDKEVLGKLAYGGNVTAAIEVGRAIAERAIAAGIKKACFDRGPFRYHGRVAAVCEAAREAGLDLGAGKQEDEAAQEGTEEGAEPKAEAKPKKPKKPKQPKKQK